MVSRWVIKDLEMWEIALRRGLNWCALGGHFAFDNVRKSVCTLIEKRQLYAFPQPLFAKHQENCQRQIAWRGVTKAIPIYKQIFFGFRFSESLELDEIGTGARRKWKVCHLCPRLMDAHLVNRRRWSAVSQAARQSSWAAVVPSRRSLQREKIIAILKNIEYEVVYILNN